MPQIDTDLASAFTAVRRVHGRSVRYVREASGVDLELIPRGPPRFARLTATQAVVDWCGWDWLIPADELVLDDAEATPQPGDQLIETLASGATRLHEVMPAGEEPCWRWSDPGRSVRRVHTKEVA